MLNESLLSKISAYCRPSLIFVYEFIACLVDSTPISAGCDSLVKYLLDCVLIRVASVTKALVSHTLPGSIGFRKFFLFRRLRIVLLRIFTSLGGILCWTLTVASVTLFR